MISTRFMASLVRRLLLLILLLAGTFYLEGCSLLIWGGALDRTVENPRIRPKIIVVSDAATTGSLCQYLLLDYSTSDRFFFKNFYYFAIPIDERMPRPPFAYNGSQRTVIGIRNDLRPEQLTRIRDFQFTREDYRLGKKLDQHPSPSNPDLPKLLSRFKGIPLDGTGVTLIPYWWLDEHNPSLDEFSSPWGNDEPFDPKTRFLVVPSNQERLGSERAKSIAGAAIVTPVTLLFDIILLPFYFLS